MKKYIKKILTALIACITIAGLLVTTSPIVYATQTTIITYTADGSFTVPYGVASVVFTAIGGGGGSGGLTTDTFAIGGGGGGNYAIATVSVTAGQVYTIVVGAGGNAGSATGPTAGTRGATSSVDLSGTMKVLASGGLPSSGNSRTGAATTTAGNVGDTIYSGGGGGTSSGTTGGGGGESGCSTGPGNSGSAPTAGSGCDGGDGGTGASNGVGGTPAAPGGGGGGSASTGTNDRAGRAGALGQVTVTYTAPVIAAFSDNFDDNSIDDSKWWTYLGDVGWSITETGQHIVIQPAANSSPQNSDLVSQGYYDITGTSTSVQVVQVAHVSADLETDFFLQNKGAVNTDATAGFYISGTTPVLNAYSNGTTIGTTTFATTTNGYLRMREASGKMYWEYGADSQSWTIMASTTSPLSGPFEVHLQVIEYANVASPDASIFDNFNVVTSAPAGTSSSPASEFYFD